MKNFLKKYPKIYAIRYGIFTTLIVAVSILIDLLSKIFTDGKFGINILGEFLKFNSTHNYGAAYGIFSGQSIGLIIVTSIVLVVILIYNYFKKNKTILYSISAGLIIGGAIGNLIDRIFLGYVRDFIKFSIFEFTCNIADICLTFGVILFVIYLIFFDEMLFRKNKTKNAENKQNIQQENTQQPQQQTENQDLTEQVENQNVTQNSGGQSDE